MRFNELRVAAGIAVFTLGGCALEVETSEETGASEAPLYGDFDTFDCSSTQSSFLSQGHFAGKLIALIPEFDACLRSRVHYAYLPCNEDGDLDPFYSSTRAVQYTNALSIMRSGNTADVDVHCDDIDSSGLADIDEYGDDEEDVTLSRSYIDGKASGGLDFWERADLGGTIWHEAMHQQGYRHSNDEESDDPHCGYPISQYSRGFNSIPYFADRCMRSAGIHDRLMVWASDQTWHAFGPGRYRAALGEFGNVGDNRIATMRLPPASAVRVCRDEGASGTGSTCMDFENNTIEYGDFITLGGALANAASFVEVEPVAIVFSGQNYGMNRRVLRYGEHLAINNAFTPIPNDQIRSIYVPAGVRVRACEHDGGVGGHGGGLCTVIETSVPVLGTLDLKVSYVEVVRVVTGFAEMDLYGARDSYDPGLYRTTDSGLGAVGNDNMVSLVVPFGLTAKLCPDVSASGAPLGQCQFFTKSTFNFPGFLPNTVSYMEVTPMTLGTQRLNVFRSGATGRVVSFPSGIDCGGDCIGDYHTRSEVQLRATPPTGGTATWTNCDRIVGTTCYVTMTGTRNAQVNFTAPTFDQACYNACLPGCLAEGNTHSFCVPACRAECTS